MINIRDPKKPVILFIPEAGIYPFARALAVLGDAIKKQGGKVFITRDSGQMFRNSIAAMYSMPALLREEDTQKIISQNDKLLKRIVKKYGFSIIEFSDLIDEVMLSEINSLISVDALEESMYKGFPVGKISQYDFVLETKFSYSSGISELHKELYQQYIKNTTLSVALANRICEEYDPSLFITFNEYAQCQAVRYSAETHGVGRMAVTYPTHLNVDASKLLVWKSTCEYWRYMHFQRWHEGKDIPILRKYVEECFRDIIFRMYASGTHIFSTRKQRDPGSVFKQLNLDPLKKIIVAYTSTVDERDSVEIGMKLWKEDPGTTDAFPNQIEWLTFLQQYARSHADIQIVVRIHPREGKRRGGFESKHLQELRDAFKEKVPSFTIVWPDNPISSYDLMEFADVCLVPWSLMGQEAARIGIPVLSHTANMMYQDGDGIRVAKTPEEYEKKLDTLLKTDFTWDFLVKAIRYYHWRVFVPSLDLGETVPTTIQDDTVWPEAPESMVGIINDILSGTNDVITYNREVWEKSLPIDAEARESEAIAQGIRVFLHNVFYPPVSYEQKFGAWFKIYRKAKKEMGKLYRTITGTPFKTKEQKVCVYPEYRLEYTEDSSEIEKLCLKTKRDKTLRIIVHNGLNVILIHKGKTLHRGSPVVGKLARLHSSYMKYNT